MKDLRLSEIELEKRINGFLTRKFSTSAVKKSSKIDRTSGKGSDRGMQWRQYSL